MMETQDQIEQLESEIEEQRELIKQFEDDQAENGANHSNTTKTCKKAIARLTREIDFLKQQIEETNDE